MNKKIQQKLKTDLPLVVIGFLAILPIPRVVMHDLHIVSLDSLTYKIFAIAPILVWIGVAVIRRNKRPFIDFMLFGLLFGVFLALTHQLLWDASWGANIPHLGGNLAGKLNPLTENIILRSFAVIGSVTTGLIAGIALSFIASASMRVRAMFGNGTSGKK